jgi:DNA-binding NtrC family response regulator
MVLEHLGATVVGLVVSDVAMPRMGGIELPTLIRRQWPVIPVPLISGYAGPSTGYPGPFLAKPFTPDALIASVKALLEAPPLGAPKH